MINDYSHRAIHAGISRRQRGLISHWDAHRGFGFVKRDGERDCFVHICNINGSQEDMRVGQRVEFEVGTDRNGRPEAKNVALIDY